MKLTVRALRGAVHCPHVADPDRGSDSDRRELAVFNNRRKPWGPEFFIPHKELSFSNAIFIDRYTVSVIENVRRFSEAK